MRQMARSHVQPRSLAGYKDLLRPVTCEGKLDMKVCPVTESHVQFSWQSFYFMIDSDGEFYYFQSKLDRDSGDVHGSDSNGKNLSKTDRSNASGAIPLEDILRVKSTDNTLRLYSAEYVYFLRAPSKDAMREWFFTIHRTFIGQLLDKLAENRHQRSYGPLSSRKHKEGFGDRDATLESGPDADPFRTRSTWIRTGESLLSEGGEGAEEGLGLGGGIGIDRAHTLARTRSGGYYQSRRWSHSIDLDQNGASSDSHSSGSEELLTRSNTARSGNARFNLQYPNHLRTVDELGIPVPGESQIEQLPTSARAPSPPALLSPTPGSTSPDANASFLSPSPRHAYFDSSKRVVEAPLEFSKDAGTVSPASTSSLLHHSLSDDSVISRPCKLPSVSEECKQNAVETEVEAEVDREKGDELDGGRNGFEQESRMKPSQRALRIDVNASLPSGKPGVANGKKAQTKSGKYVPPHLRGQNVLGETCGESFDVGKDIRSSRSSSDDDIFAMESTSSTSNAPSAAQDRFGTCAKQGHRMSMQDFHCNIGELTLPLNRMATSDSFPLSFHAIYDGHCGTRVAELAATRLHVLAVEEELMFEQWPQGTMSAVERAFERIDEEFTAMVRNSAEPLLDGSCAIISLIKQSAPRAVAVANLGDSRAVLSQSGRAIDLSTSHSPGRADERERIISAGGWITTEREIAVGRLHHMDLDDPTIRQRAQQLNYEDIYRVNGELCVSRALGDLDYKLPHVNEYKHWFFLPGHPGYRELNATTNASQEAPPMFQFGDDLVIAKPEWEVRDLVEEDEFLILACDGLWDVMSSQEAVDIAKRSNGDCRRASEELVNTALRMGTNDNVTATVISLKRQPVE